MIIVYHCFGGTHSSVVAAYIHLGRLPTQRLPEKKELITLPYFDSIPSEKIGTPFFAGFDEKGNRVFILGTGSCRETALRSLSDFLPVYGLSLSEVLFVHAGANLDFIIKLGGFLSRRLKIKTLGRLLIIWGIRRRYPLFLRQVKETRAAVQSLYRL